MKITSATLVAACVITLTSTGCASNSELARVRTEAMEARRVADHALNEAQEANRRSERAEDMVNRSFKHSMRK
jgi:hypothetical protein